MEPVSWIRHRKAVKVLPRRLSNGHKARIVPSAVLCGVSTTANLKFGWSRDWTNLEDPSPRTCVIELGFHAVMR